ncbi:MAG: NYN domain-containing protein [Pelolinea sp.]|nr:NYN domain-containing protein [Pelolinea sp.]
MPYLIDGHNLIPKIPGIQLNHLDDELSLFAILDNYFKQIRKKGVVYFDHASHGAPTVPNTAYLQAHFVRKPSSADEAILLRLNELGGDARNYTIVTSDHWVADNARSAGASVVSSDDFARTLRLHTQNSFKKLKTGDENDIDFWLDIFQSKS